MLFRKAISISSKLLKARSLLYNTNRVLNLQKPIAKFLKPNYLKGLVFSKLIFESLTGLGKFLFFMWEFTSMIGLFSFTIAMICVAYDCSSYVVSFVSMCIPFLPESMLVFTIPFLVDLGLYVPQETWMQWISNNFITTYNYTYDSLYLLFSKSYSWLYFIILTPYYLIYYPISIVSSLTSYILGLTTWLMGIATILISIKLWVLWEVISHEANVIMTNLNLENPIPAYLMATFYHAIIRPGQMVMSTGGTFIVEYLRLLLPTWNDCYDLLSWVVTGRATIIWNHWTSIGTYLAHLSIYPVSIAGVIIDPLSIVIWFHWSMFDHGIIRPGLFITTLAFTRIGRSIGILAT